MSRIESRGNQNYADSKIGFARLFLEKEFVMEGQLQGRE